MKKGLLLIFTLAIVINYLSAQSKDGFTIQGNFQGLKNGTLVYLVKINDSGGSDKAGRIIAKWLGENKGLEKILEEKLGREKEQNSSTYN